MPCLLNARRHLDADTLRCACATPPACIASSCADGVARAARIHGAPECRPSSRVRTAFRSVLRRAVPSSREEPEDEVNQRQQRDHDVQRSFLSLAAELLRILMIAQISPIKNQDAPEAVSYTEHSFFLFLRSLIPGGNRDATRRCTPGEA